MYGLPGVGVDKVHCSLLYPAHVHVLAKDATVSAVGTGLKGFTLVRNVHS